MKVNWIKLYGKLTFRYFFLICYFSSSKLLEILCALCKSSRIAFLLYFFGPANDQWLGILDSFTTTDVLMIPFLIIISVSKNLLGFTFIDIHQLVLSIYHLLRKYNFCTTYLITFWKLISYKKAQALSHVNFIKNKTYCFT